ncbi:hypothetical protein J0911_12605 [Myceligenerans salitolerans]|uniref:Cysteine-rich CPCC domain-containing protein n=1 Tax=Myceligenerans salitolerans TaxID=1230528 RepID=A0ABS3IA11_9MICO|nr:hypothetical protein [Myceligenerans salitolerans]
MSDRFPCPCCGHQVFDQLPGSYEICGICFWEDDAVQLRWPDYRGGANRPSPVHAQANDAKSSQQRHTTPQVRCHLPVQETPPVLGGSVMWALRQRSSWPRRQAFSRRSRRRDRSSDCRTQATNTSVAISARVPLDAKESDSTNCCTSSSCTAFTSQERRPVGAPTGSTATLFAG